jgi:tetratricopeptide (TPR) repeat protein
VEALEGLSADRLPEQVERLAHHALRGEVWDKAVTYCRQAGARAMTHSASYEAVTSFEQALDALRHLPARPDTQVLATELRLDLRNALTLLGELERILVCLQDAAALAEAVGDHHRLGWISVYLLAHFMLACDPDHAFASGQRALAIAADLEDVGLTVAAQTYLGGVYHCLGDYRRAVEYCQKTLVRLHGELLQERLGLPGLASVQSRGFLTLSLAECGAFAEGRAPAEEGVRIAEAADHPYSRVVAYWAVGWRSLYQGDLLQAIPMLERALDLTQGHRFRSPSPGSLRPWGLPMRLLERIGPRAFTSSIMSRREISSYSVYSPRSRASRAG